MGTVGLILKDRKLKHTMSIAFIRILSVREEVKACFLLNGNLMDISFLTIAIILSLLEHIKIVISNEKIAKYLPKWEKEGLK
mgnify:CR=1 FL=1